MLSSLSRLQSSMAMSSHALAPFRTMYVRVTSTPNVAMQRLNEKLSEEGLERLMKARKVGSSLHCLCTAYPGELIWPSLTWYMSLYLFFFFNSPSCMMEWRRNYSAPFLMSHKLHFFFYTLFPLHPLSWSPPGIHAADVHEAIPGKAKK